MNISGRLVRTSAVRELTIRVKSGVSRRDATQSEAKKRRGEDRAAEGEERATAK